MNSWTIGRRLAVVFVAVQAVVLAVGVLTYVRLADIDAAATSLRRADVGDAATAVGVRDAIKDVSSAVWQHAAATDEGQKTVLEKELLRTVARAVDTADAYGRRLGDERERTLHAEIETALGEYRRVLMEKALPLHRVVPAPPPPVTTAEVTTATVTTDDAAVTTVDAPAAVTQAPAASGPDPAALAAAHTELRGAYQQLTSAIDAAVQQRDGAVQAGGAAVAGSVGSAQMAVLVGVLISLGVSAGLAVWLVRGTNQTLRHSVTALGDSAAQVASASGQVSTSAQSLSQGASEQAASLEETSASMEEMAAMTRRNATHSQQAARLMTEVEGRVNASDASLRAMVTAMGRIEESSGKVSRIIRTIDEIAFQTNILALNAAVEAARAGDAGMGFAVVADEVRSLAQRSAQAAKDTEALIEESVLMSREGSARVEQVATAIAGITDSVKQVKGLVDEVSVASQQQSQGIDQVSQAITQMERVTQSNAATAEESAAASEQLNAQASTTLAVVARLQAFVGRGTPATIRTAPARAAYPYPPTATTPAPAPVAAAAPARVVSMPAARRQQAAPAQSAEEFLPLGDTGTFGKF
jgi:hypothetical protein